MRDRSVVRPVPAVFAGQVIDGRFELLDRAGSGSGGETWRARDLLGGGTVALKVSTGPAHGEAARQRGEPVRSVNLARLLAQGVAPDHRSYQATEWLPGLDLAQVVLRGPLRASTAAWTGCHLARGLAALHAAGQVHGDVRPENVRLVRSGDTFTHAVLLDPLARGQRGNLRTESPECALSGIATAQSDLYALGCVLHWALTGRPPFDGEPAEVVVLHRYAPRPPLPDGVSAQLGQLVLQLMDVEPGERPASAAAVAELLEWMAAAADLELAGLPVAAIAPLAKPRSLLAFGGDLIAGREGEKEWLLRRALQGSENPVWLCVRGPRGMGVSRLLAWLAEEAESQGIPTTIGSAPRDEGPPAGPVPSPDLFVDAEVDVEHRARSLAAALQPRGGLWIVDDAHDLTAAELRSVVRAGHIAAAAGARVAVVLGWSSGAATELPPPPDLLGSWTAANLVTLAPLGLAAVADWAARVVPAAAPEVLLADTHGIPARMVEWACRQAQAAVDAAAHQPRWVHPGRLEPNDFAPSRQAELRRLLGRAGPRRALLRSILHAVALSRRPLDSEELGQVAAEAPDEVGAAVRLALECQALVHAGRPGQLRVGASAWRAAIVEAFGDSARDTHAGLAALAAARRDSVFELPHHLWRADKPAAAWTNARAAIELALRTPDYRVADELLADVEEYGDSSGVLTIAEWSTALWQRATVLIHLGRPREAESRFAELRALDGQFDATAPEAAVTGLGWVGLAAAAEARGEYANAAALAERGLEKHREFSAVHAELLLILGKSQLLASGNPAAEEAMQRAEKAFARLGLSEGQHRTWVELALVAAYRRDVHAGRSWLALADRVATLNPLLHARRLYVAGLVAEAAAEPDEAMRLLREAAIELDRMGHLRGLAGAQAGQAIVLRRMGRFAEADQVLSAAIAAREALGDQRGLAQTLNNLADLRVVSGRPGEAIALAERALAIAKGLGPTIHSIFAHCTLAEANLALGQHLQAKQSADASLAANGDPPARPAAAVTCLGVLAELAAHQGDHVRAFELMKHAARLQAPRER